MVERAGTQNGGSYPAGNGGSGGGGLHIRCYYSICWFRNLWSRNPGVVVPSTSNECGAGGGAGGSGFNGGLGPSTKQNGGSGTNTYSAWWNR